MLLWGGAEKALSLQMKRQGAGACLRNRKTSDCAGKQEVRENLSRFKGMHIVSGRGDCPQAHGLSKVTRFTDN